METRLMPWLAQRLPLPVPIPHVVIDFSDAHVGDPALDLAWALHAAPPAFARAVAAEYDAAPELTERALLWHRLGPRHEVTHGLDTGDPDTVCSGLEGILARLPA